MFGRAARSRLVPGGLLAAMIFGGCQTGWMWLNIENCTDAPVRVRFSGRESVMSVDLAPGQRASLEGYDLRGEIVAGSKVLEVKGVHNSCEKISVVGSGDAVEAKSLRPR